MGGPVLHTLYSIQLILQPTGSSYRRQIWHVYEAIHHPRDHPFGLRDLVTLYKSLLENYDPSRWMVVVFDSFHDN